MGEWTKKLEVVVCDLVPATAEISVAQLESYLRRTGWGQIRTHGRAAWRLKGARDDLFVRADDSVREMRVYIEYLAAHEARRPSAVLADIAREIDG